MSGSLFCLYLHKNAHACVQVCGAIRFTFLPMVSHSVGNTEFTNLCKWLALDLFILNQI